MAFWSILILVTPVNQAPPIGITTSCVTESYETFGGLVDWNTISPAPFLITKATPEGPEEPVTDQAIVASPTVRFLATEVDVVELEEVKTVVPLAVIVAVPVEEAINVYVLVSGILTVNEAEYVAEAVKSPHTPY